MEYNKTPSTPSLEQLLQDTMTVSPSAVSQQNQMILSQIQCTNQSAQDTPKPRHDSFHSLRHRLRILAPVPVLCLLFIITCSITVFAASPSGYKGTLVANFSKFEKV